jgi:hypothetical protein
MTLRMKEVDPAYGSLVSALMELSNAKAAVDGARDGAAAKRLMEVRYQKASDEAVSAWRKWKDDNMEEVAD